MRRGKQDLGQLGKVGTSKAINQNAHFCMKVNEVK